MPRVAMNAFTRSFVMTSPLTRPTPAPNRSGQDAQDDPGVLAVHRLGRQDRAETDDPADREVERCAGSPASGRRRRCRAPPSERTSRGRCRRSELARPTVVDRDRDQAGDEDNDQDDEHGARYGDRAPPGPCRSPPRRPAGGRRADARTRRSFEPSRGTTGDSLATSCSPVAGEHDVRLLRAGLELARDRSLPPR